VEVRNAQRRGRIPVKMPIQSEQQVWFIVEGSVIADALALVYRHGHNTATCGVCRAQNKPRWSACPAEEPSLLPFARIKHSNSLNTASY